MGKNAQSFSVDVWLLGTSQPLHYDALNCYEKGSYTCIYATDGLVYKYPTEHVFRIIEAYRPGDSENAS